MRPSPRPPRSRRRRRSRAVRDATVRFGQSRQIALFAFAGRRLAAHVASTARCLGRAAAELSSAARNRARWPASSRDDQRRPAGHRGASAAATANGGPDRRGLALRPRGRSRHRPARDRLRRTMGNWDRDTRRARSRAGHQQPPAWHFRRWHWDRAGAPRAVVDSALPGWRPSPGARRRTTRCPESESPIRADGAFRIAALAHLPPAAVSRCAAGPPGDLRDRRRHRVSPPSRIGDPGLGRTYVGRVRAAPARQEVLSGICEEFHTSATDWGRTLQSTSDDGLRTSGGPSHAHWSGRYPRSRSRVAGQARVTTSTR